MKKCSKTNNKPNIIEKTKLKFKDFIIDKNGLFWIALILTALSVISPLILQIPQIKHIDSFFFRALTAESYKSSFVESIGSILGIALTITGTLFIQKKIDEMAEKEKREKEANDVKYRIIVIYYDLKLAFEDIETIYNIMMFSAFSTEEDRDIVFYDAASKYNLYIDEGWIRNVASLHNVLDKKLLEQVFLIYGDICSINTALKSKEHDKYQTARIVGLMGRYIGNGKTPLKAEYVDILEQLRIAGGITENDDD